MYEHRGIYKLKCLYCPLRYMGQTGRSSQLELKSICKPLNKIKMLQIMLLAFSTVCINEVILMIHWNCYTR
jgi:hypothetical protein